MRVELLTEKRWSPGHGAAPSRSPRAAPQGPASAPPPGARPRLRRLRRLLTNGGQNLSAVYSADGTQIGVSAPDGLLLVGNDDTLIRKLPVPGVNAKVGCPAVRWWSTSTLLASCFATGVDAPQLWLAPAGGAAPSALTPPRTSPGAANDLGDIDAWQLPSGLYLQSLVGCSAVELTKQASDGSVAKVAVPGMTDSPAVVTASVSQLLMKQEGCDGTGGQLAGFNPATGSQQWIFKTGLGSVIGYSDSEDAPSA